MQRVIWGDAAHKGLIVRDTTRSVGYRRSVILVPMGNPEKIESLDDLTRKGVKVGVSIAGCLAS